MSRACAWVWGPTLLCAIALVAFVLRPRDEGEPYTEYFRSLDVELKDHGPGRPMVLLDLDRLDRNLAVLEGRLELPLHYRVVVKSLPSLDLLRYIVRATGTRRLMVFHSMDLVMLLDDPEFRSFDMLLGKPMPRAALAEVYRRTSRQAVGRIRWLVDTPARLEQYLSFAREEGLRLPIDLELDVGLHRGGFADRGGFLAALRTIAENPEHLGFAGTMGYEPQVASVSVLFGSKLPAMERELTRSLAVYAGYVASGREAFPELFRGDVVFNGGGSKTYRFYQDHPGVVDDVSAGSALVKPSAFDAESLEDHVPAVYIATPVLKRLAGTTIPLRESVSFLFPLWDPNRQVTYFTYGGSFTAEKESPRGLKDNTLYGASTNQGILNGSSRTDLHPDDYVFCRPTQSEKVMAEMGEIHLLRGGKLAGVWKTFSN
jgi:D-serine deaminase-like pyridoxal phosphate-dependent protein